MKYVSGLSGTISDLAWDAAHAAFVTIEAGRSSSTTWRLERRDSVCLAGVGRFVGSETATFTLVPTESGTLVSSSRRRRATRK
jgi:hypothetical protein